MASSSLAADPDNPGGAADRHLDRLLQGFTPVTGTHEPYSETSRHCRACSAHFGFAVLFPCLSYQYQQRRNHGRHGEEAQ